MFTGLISHIGRIISCETSTGGTKRLVVETLELARSLHEGDSISVNGVCLTALDLSDQTFAADLATETVARTKLSELKPGTVVNLELPMKAGAPLGGHIVQGHVDGMGTIDSFERVADGEEWWLIISVPTELARNIVHKGSITIDGISLTVAAVKANQVSIAVIPHTYSVTNLHTLKTSDRVNIEVDVLVKYAEKQHASDVTIEQLFALGF